MTTLLELQKLSLSSTLTLQDNETQIIYGIDNPLNLTGIYSVVLPDDSTSLVTQKYIIQNVKGCVPGQVILFFNNNKTKYYSFDSKKTKDSNINYLRTPKLYDVTINHQVSAVWDGTVLNINSEPIEYLEPPSVPFVQSPIVTRVVTLVTPVILDDRVVTPIVTPVILDAPVVTPVEPITQVA
jgi:hypothetical protein